MSQIQLDEVTETIDALWELHDDAQNAGDTALAGEYASHALRLVEKLPKNHLYLSTKH